MTVEQARERLLALTEQHGGYVSVAIIEADKQLAAIAAAQLLLSWSYLGRVRSEAAFARLAGCAPIPAEGRTSRRVTSGRCVFGRDRRGLGSASGFVRDKGRVWC